MIWFGLGIAIIALFLVMQTRKGRAALHNAEMAPEDGTVFFPGAAMEDDEESEILAVITAAIAEFEGDSDFQVASIKRRSNNWKLTGCQELVGSRLN
ncbi:hypothetical protein [Sporomusa sp.]|uniref:hypothetical protein n=1 Tax=Sporomusa sp. TaxID=2078658 RepID=UPI002C65F1AB|nr:hypothetical protein [Sporomusa sp.]HWR45973.1 hypothetical protein [Sporomusa sp.]